MPTTVSELFENAGLLIDGPVGWSNPVENGDPGVYVVSMSDDPNENLANLPIAPISIEAITEWISRIPSIELDGVGSPTADAILKRLANFWLPDENILYIGMTNAKVRTRVSQYYRTPLGDRKPHAGGHWLKALTNLSDMYIYHAACPAPKSKEDQLLGYFVANVSTGTKKILKDSVHPFPFANLEYPQGTRKNHGIGKSTCKLFG